MDLGTNKISSTTQQPNEMSNAVKRKKTSFTASMGNKMRFGTSSLADSKSVKEGPPWLAGSRYSKQSERKSIISRKS